MSTYGMCRLSAACKNEALDKEIENAQLTAFLLLKVVGNEGVVGKKWQTTQI
jgi:hypothetical protein